MTHTLIHNVKVPVLARNEVFHIGTMNPADKGSHSYEGHGLSVSTCPKSWYRIARLGGYGLFKLTRADSRFMDFHKAVKGKTLMRHVTSWATAEGLVVPAAVFRVSWYDDEIDDTRFMEFASREQALEEAEGHEAEDEAGNFVEPADMVTERQAVIHTAKASALLRWHRTDPIETTDAMLILYAENVGLDGVWWNDKHNVSELSAPRGVIFPEKLAEWSKESIDPAEYDV